MASMLRDYQRHRNVLTSIARRSSALAAEAAFVEMSQLFQSIADDVAAHTFRIMVVGRFKAGKSTLINALLGQAILPSGSLPTTAALTSILYGQSPHFLVRTLDLDPPSATITEHADLAELRQFVQISKDQSTAPVRTVQLFLPQPLLKDGVELVDSPGLDESPIRQAITLQEIPHADALVIAMNAMGGFGTYERDFLRRVTTSLGFKDVFVAFTFADQHRGDEELHEHNHRMAAEFIHDPARICDVSAQMALDARIGGSKRLSIGTGIPEFERVLLEFLGTERWRSKARRFHRLLVPNLISFRKDLDRQLRLSRMSAEDLQRAYHDAEEQLETLRLQEVAITQDLRKWRTSCEKGLTTLYRSFQSLAAAKAPEWAAESAREHKGDAELIVSPREGRAFQEAVADGIASRLQDYYLHWLSTDVRGFLASQTLKLESGFERRLQVFTQEVLALQSAILSEHTPSSDARLSERKRILELFDDQVIAPIGVAARARVAVGIALPSAAITGAILAFSWPLALIGLASIPIVVSLPAGRAKIIRLLYERVGREYSRRIAALPSGEGAAAARDELGDRAAAIETYMKGLLNGLEDGILRAIETSSKSIDERNVAIRLLEHASEQVSQLQQELFLVEREL